MVGQLQWTKDGFGLGIERNLEGFSRYSMIGADDEGECLLCSRATQSLGQLTRLGESCVLSLLNDFAR